MKSCTVQRRRVSVRAAFPLLAFLPIAFVPPQESPMQYPNAKILAEARELLDSQAAAAMRILDVRAADAYRKGHIPGAVWIDAEQWAARSRQAGTLQDARVWSELVGSLGIDAETPVVVYDETVTPTAARIWWLLRYAGHPNVRLLNGGLAAWREADGAITTDQPKIAATKFEPRLQKQMLADQDFVRRLVGQPDACLIDARSLAEYTGQRAQGPRGGRVPGSKHLEWSNFLDERGRIKPPAELAKLLEDRHIASDQTAVTYCQSGGRAALDAFVLDLMGFKDVKNYYGSWAEWSADEQAPIETGE
jgi:thiosulfate/3-mercaptopyruvate sulfurtransferase